MIDCFRILGHLGPHRNWDSDNPDAKKPMFPHEWEMDERALEE